MPSPTAIAGQGGASTSMIDMGGGLEGVRIQIVDKNTRSMFDLGSAELEPYSVEI